MTFAEGRLDLVELLFAEEDVLIFFILVALHDSERSTLRLQTGQNRGCFEPRMTHIVELVEADALAARWRRTFAWEWKSTQR